MDPAVREYYEKLGVEIPDPNNPEHDNNISASKKDSVKVDNSFALTENKNVSDLNKKNRVSSVSSSSDNYFIPYGDRTRTGTSDSGSITNLQKQDSVNKGKDGNLILGIFMFLIWFISIMTVFIQPEHKHK